MLFYLILSCTIFLFYIIETLATSIRLAYIFFNVSGVSNSILIFYVLHFNRWHYMLYIKFVIFILIFPSILFYTHFYFSRIYFFNKTIRVYYYLFLLTIHYRDFFLSYLQSHLTSLLYPIFFLNPSLL